MNRTIKKIIKKYLLFFWDESYKKEPELELSRKILLLNYLFVAIICFLIPFGLLALFQGDIILGTLDLAIALFIFSARIYYLKTLNYKFLANSIIFVLGSFYLYLLSSGGYHNSGPLWSYTLPVTVLFLFGKKRGFFLILIYFFLSILLLFLDLHPNIYTISYKVRFLGSFLATAIITYYVEYIREGTQLNLLKKNIEIKKSLEQLDLKDKELTERELHYRTLFEKSNDAIFLMAENLFIDCNPKALSLFNCTREDIINKSPDIFSPIKQPTGGYSKDLALKKINSALNGNHLFFEWVHKKLDGTNFYAEVSLDKIEVADKNILLASVRDISDRKLVEEALLLAKERAEKSDRLKSDFLAQMSHEIRTPINTIMNYTSLLQMELEDKTSDDNKGSFKSIQNAAYRLLRTIDLILNISDLEAGTYEPKFEQVNLVEKVILPVVNEFKQAAENKNLSLSFKNNLVEAPNVKIDNYTVSQTIANLLDNAIKYTSKGKITVLTEKEENYLIVKIEDTGVGISKEYLPNLFDKFSQEEAGYTRRFEGSGLGLALVKKYCIINNIEISVKSEKGIGTTFTLKLKQ